MGMIELEKEEEEEEEEEEEDEEDAGDSAKLLESGEVSMGFK
jgi:hypothetical protein